MFVVLDTNHFRELREDTAAGKNLQRRIEEHEADVFTCIVAVEETIAGWFALIHRHAAGRDQIKAYTRLHQSIEALIKLPILPFDDAAADVFHRLRDARVRAGTMDLKIAAICIVHGALLLTRNLVDFEKVPGLRVENWLD
jgi:tRNA(fMet)-specific endonuclease VapC